MSAVPPGEEEAQPASSLGCRQKPGPLSPWRGGPSLAPVRPLPLLCPTERPPLPSLSPPPAAHRLGEAPLAESGLELAQRAGGEGPASWSEGGQQPGRWGPSGGGSGRESGDAHAPRPGELKKPSAWARPAPEEGQDPPAVSLPPITHTAQSALKVAEPRHRAQGRACSRWLRSSALNPLGGAACRSFRTPPSRSPDRPESGKADVDGGA